MLAAALACGAVSTQSTERRQDKEGEERAAAARALVILKIAPYIAPASAPAEAPPAAKGKRYRVGIVGTDAVAAAALRELPGRKVDQATVDVAEITPKAAADGKAAADCDLLFIAASVDEVTLACIVAAYRDKPVVLVCERAGFVSLGGGVQLFVHENCVRFEVNGDALKKQGLRPSAQLLKLSRKGPCK